MNKTIDTFTPVNQPEYSNHFWNFIMGEEGHRQYLDLGYQGTDAYVLPPHSAEKFSKKLKAESLFRRVATSLYSPDGPSTILAKVNYDSASWVALGEEIPVYNGINDFTTYNLEDYKLAILMQMDASFLHSNRYIFEDYLLDRLVKNFSSAEEDGFINGTGENMPTGILAAEGGAEIGVTSNALTYDDVIKLYFSLKKEYRKNAVWLMNSETALVLRSLKDSSGQPIWNHTNDTIMGKKVYISEYMPNAASGEKPIAFGDFKFFWIVDRSEPSMRILREKFFETGQIGYVAFELLDGKLIRPEAIKVMQMTNTVA